MLALLVNLIQRFQLKAWKIFIRNLSHEEAQTVLLNVIQQTLVTDFPEEVAKLPDIEKSIYYLGKKKTQDIMLQAIELHQTKMRN